MIVMCTQKKINITKQNKASRSASNSVSRYFINIFAPLFGDPPWGLHQSRQLKHPSAKMTPKCRCRLKVMNNENIARARDSQKNLHSFMTQFGNPFLRGWGDKKDECEERDYNKWCQRRECDKSLQKKEVGCTFSLEGDVLDL
uniref:(northern house mosquito) hypothetical protein n=1 Tax=Culex pipiens TaxID=7175 RepID=A0A8D8AIR9_CULPI